MEKPHRCLSPSEIHMLSRLLASSLLPRPRFVTERRPTFCCKYRPEMSSGVMQSICPLPAAPLPWVVL